MTTWDWQFATEILPEMMDGVKVTIMATFFGTIVATIMGFLIMLMRRANNRLVAGFAYAYIYFFRGTPLLIQFYFAYYVLPLVGLRAPAFVAGALTLGLNYTTYFAESYRSGIQSVPKGQWEAARALSFSPRRIWISVVLPQAIKPMLPALGNHINLMFKMSALMSAISILDIFGTAITIGNSVYRYLEPITMAGVLYLAVSIPVSILIQRAEARQRSAAAR